MLDLDFDYMDSPSMVEPPPKPCKPSWFADCATCVGTTPGKNANSLPMPYLSLKHIPSQMYVTVDGIRDEERLLQLATFRLGMRLSAAGYTD